MEADPRPAVPGRWRPLQAPGSGPSRGPAPKHRSARAGPSSFSHRLSCYVQIRSQKPSEPHVPPGLREMLGAHCPPAHATRHSRGRRNDRWPPEGDPCSVDLFSFGGALRDQSSSCFPPFSPPKLLPTSPRLVPEAPCRSSAGPHCGRACELELELPFPPRPLLPPRVPRCEYRALRRGPTTRPDGLRLERAPKAAKRGASKARFSRASRSAWPESRLN